MKFRISTHPKRMNSLGTKIFIATGPIILANNPTNNNEAATKSYVDTAFNNLNATNLTSGTIPVNRLPAFTGDVTSISGTNNLVLQNSGVLAGTYTKVTVNSKGLVTSGTTLSPSDIPNFNWNKITTNKPTTLEGYGITNALSINGGVVSGFISVNDPTLALHAATKQYVDNASSSSGGYSVGDIIRRPNNTTPTGFLRCNGAWVSKTTYANLYAVIGDTYNYIIHIGNGKPWKQQYDINTDQSGDITGWTTGTPLPTPLTSSQAIVTKNRVYLLGGYNDNIGSVSTVYTALINADGTLGAWTTSTPLPEPIEASQVIVTKNRVYLLGGYNDNIGSVSTVYTATINTDGTLGAWTKSTPLPEPLSDSQAIIIKNRVYLLGGRNGTDYLSTVYTAPINIDGTLGAWTTSIPLPGPLSYSQAIVTKNRVYLLGGWYGIPMSTVYTAPINTDGTLGTWSEDTSLPEQLYSSQAIVTKNRVYLFGGFANSGNSSTIYTAPINADGTLGAWATGASLPEPLSSIQAIVTKNRVYLLGANDGTNGFSPIVYSAPILGGLNDYSPYYDGTIILTDPDNFRLPDLTSKEEDIPFFIKY